MKNVMSLTDAAAQQIKRLIDKHNRPSFGIRIGVKSGGCSGLSYYVEYADVKNKLEIHKNVSLSLPNNLNIFHPVKYL